MADGRSKATVTVTLDDGSGHTVPDGTQVHFSTTSGILDPAVAVSVNGIARTTLTSSPIAGTARISASFISSAASANGYTTVEFTTDSALANTDQVMANWIRVTSPGYLAYGADSRTVDAASPKQGVHIAYRGIVIDANAAQVDLDGDIVRAQHATIRHGHLPTVSVDTLLYYLDSQQGTAIIMNAPGQHTVQTVNVDGSTLETKPLPKGQAGQRTDYDFQDLSQGHVLITASALSVQPHAQIQLARATIFIDSKKIVSMPNQVMPISTDQVFGQQVLGYGTNGLFLDVPYYASLSPTSTGMFSLRSPAASVQSGTFYQGRGALALDYDRAYSDGNRQGDLKVIGLSSANWGLRWNQSQRLAGGTQSYLYLDSPGHKTVFGSMNLRHDFGAMAMNVDATTNQPLFGQAALVSRTVAFNMQTPAHRLIGDKAHGLMYSEEATYNWSTLRQKVGSTHYSNQSSTRTVGLKFNTPALVPNQHTSITDSLTVEQSYSDRNHFSALNITGNVQVMSQLSHLTSTTLSYNYTHYPQFGTAVPVIAGNRLIGLYNATDKQNLNWNFSANSPSNLWNLSLNSTYGMPTKDLTFSSGVNYRLSSQMHLGVSNYYSQLGGYTFRDYAISIAHRVGMRDLVISWSALQHRWQVDLAQAQF